MCILLKKSILLTINKMRLRKVINLIRRPKRIIKIYKERKILKSVSGVVHVGANSGQERNTYAKFNLNVIWIEPITEVFEQLIDNIKKHKKQKAFQALVTNVDDQPYQFNIANNNGQSSSIFQLKHHKEIWPKVHFNKTISLKSITLSSLFKREQIDPTKYQGLVMDTQGSELLVLEGCKSLLKHFDFIKTEVADFESYEGCCQLDEINDFMNSNGFKEYYRNQFGCTPKTGRRYFNIYYVKKNHSLLT